MSKIWDQSYAHVRKWEGGFSDVSGDSGGKTMYGIASNYFPNDYRIVKGMVDAGNKAGAQQYVKQFYYREFWVKSGAHLIQEEALALTHFDMAVNSGVGRANKILAKSNTANEYNDNRESFYRSIATGGRAKFLKGWLNRLEDARNFDPDNAPTDTTDYDVDNSSGAQTPGTGNAREPSSTPYQDNSSAGSGTRGNEAEPSTQPSNNPITENEQQVEEDGARDDLEERLADEDENENEDEEQAEDDEVEASDPDVDNKEQEVVDALADKEDLTLLDVLKMLVEKAPLNEAQLKILNALIARAEGRDVEEEATETEVVEDVQDEPSHSGYEEPAQTDNVTSDMIEMAAENYGHQQKDVSLEKFVTHNVSELLPGLENKISDYIETNYPDLGKENSTHLFSKIVEKNYSHIYEQIKTNYEMTHGAHEDQDFGMSAHHMQDIIGKDDDNLDHLVVHNSGNEGQTHHK